MAAKRRKRGGRREGAGRPRLYPDGLVSLTLHISPSARLALEREAETRGLTLSELCRERLGVQPPPPR